MVKELYNSRALRNTLRLLHLIATVCIVGGFLCILVMLLSRDMTSFTGNEVYYDKMALDIFNTLITYGGILLVITILGYSAFTEWGFVKYRFIIIKWVLCLALFCIAYFLVGNAIGGMASISDAGFHIGEMKGQYIAFRNKAVWSLIAELALSLVLMFISIRKPFGKRETKPFKYCKAVFAISVPCAILGIIAVIISNNNLEKTRKMPIKDIDVTQLADGIYEGAAEYGGNENHVKVTIEKHHITSIEDLTPRDSVYAQYATGVIPKIIDKQTPNVDAVTGATTSSKCLMKAVENALNAEPDQN